MYPMEQQTEVVMITGASQRLGAHIARFLATEGYAVIIHTKRMDEGSEALIRSLEAHHLLCKIVEGDLSDVRGIPDLFGRALALFGRVDHLVNNASSFDALPIEEITINAFESVMALHNSAPFFLSQALYTHLREEKRSGTIINICDATLACPKASRPAYYTAKGALLAQTRALAVALAPTVRVNAISPGPVLSNTTDGAYFARMREALPVSHTGEPADIERTIKFLLESPFITGEELVVDGGLRLL